MLSFKIPKIILFKVMWKDENTLAPAMAQCGI